MKGEGIVKIYESPKIEINTFAASDVVTVSTLIYVNTPPAENDKMTVTYADLWEKQ